MLGAIAALLHVQNLFHMFKGCKYNTNKFEYQIKNIPMQIK